MTIFIIIVYCCQFHFPCFHHFSFPRFYVNLRPLTLPFKYFHHKTKAKNTAKQKQRLITHYPWKYVNIKLLVKWEREKWVSKRLTSLRAKVLEIQFKGGILHLKIRHHLTFTFLFVPFVVNNVIIVKLLK